MATALVVSMTALTGPSWAAEASGTTLALSASASAKTGRTSPFTTLLLDASGTPLAGRRVVLQRLGSTWSNLTSGLSDAAGRAVLQAVVPIGRTRWRASYAGDDSSQAPSTSPEVTVTGERYASVITLSGPQRLVDETAGNLSLRWTAADGSAIRGTVTVLRRLGSGAWTSHRRLSTDVNGRASVAVAPRVDSTWRATGPAGAWWSGAASNDLRIDNVPPTAPLAYPAAAPHPVWTPPQSRATGNGAHPVLSPVPAPVWRSMVGRSWHRGCPIGRSGLRLLRINYWGFDGYRYRGEMVLSSAVAARASGALRRMYDGRYPIRRMYRVDRFGWSQKLRGANDYAAMRADNTSAFNCRSVVNKPWVRSPHARGRAVDLNTWENPYRSRTGLVPNSWWAWRSHPKVAWRSSSHPVVRIWRAHGFRWTYGTGDSQHVDGRTLPTAGSFVG